MTKEERRIIETAIDDIKREEKYCFEQIGFCNEHKFNMESEALQYKRQAYTDSWLILSSALDKIK